MDFSRTLFQIAMTYFQFMDRMWRYKNQWIMTYLHRLSFGRELVPLLLAKCDFAKSRHIITENLFNVFLLKYIYIIGFTKFEYVAFITSKGTISKSVLLVCILQWYLVGFRE